MEIATTRSILPYVMKAAAVSQTLQILRVNLLTVALELTAPGVLQRSPRLPNEALL